MKIFKSAHAKIVGFLENIIKSKFPVFGILFLCAVLNFGMQALVGLTILITDPYKMGKTYVGENSQLKEALESIKDIDLETYQSSFRKVTRNSVTTGFSEIALTVEGERGKTANAYLYYEVQNDEWKLMKAHAVLSDYTVIVLKQ